VITLSVEQLHWQLADIHLAATQPYPGRKYLQAVRAGHFALDQFRGMMTITLTSEDSAALVAERDRRRDACGELNGEVPTLKDNVSLPE
jgi:hypothetical protein